MTTKEDLSLIKRDQSIILIKYNCEEFCKRNISKGLLSLLEETFILSDIENQEVREVQLKVSSN